MYAFLGCLDAVVSTDARLRACWVELRANGERGVKIQGRASAGSQFTKTRLGRPAVVVVVVVFVVFVVAARCVCLK